MTAFMHPNKYLCKPLIAAALLNCFHPVMRPIHVPQWVAVPRKGPWAASKVCIIAFTQTGSH